MRNKPIILWVIKAEYAGDWFLEPGQRFYSSVFDQNDFDKNREPGLDKRDFVEMIEKSAADKLAEALGLLIYLKGLKEIKGKCPEYLERQPFAWHEAYRALKEYRGE